MFGLSRREQRWKAEQQAAEALLGFLKVVAEARAEVLVAQARADEAEMQRLREENARLRALSEPSADAALKDANGGMNPGESHDE